MSKKQIDLNTIDKPSTDSQDVRKAKWESYVENYKKENPVKYEAKLKAGEFDTIPLSFK